MTYLNLAQEMTEKSDFLGKKKNVVLSQGTSVFFKIRV